MSNLTNNTAGLRDILAAVQNLPEAGGGSLTTEEWTFTMEDGSTVKKQVMVDD